MNKIWHVTYHGPRFTSLNTTYKNGWTITTLKKVKDKKSHMYEVDEIIKSVDPLDHPSFEREFYAQTSDTQVLESDPYVIIKWFFEEFKSD